MRLAREPARFIQETARIASKHPTFNKIIKGLDKLLGGSIIYSHRTLDKPQVPMIKLTQTSEKLSDHEWALEPESKIVVANLLKKMRYTPAKFGVRKRTNSAYPINETNDTYMIREKAQSRGILDIVIERQDDVYIIATQEAPINIEGEEFQAFDYFESLMKEELPEGWVYFNSEHGVLTFINTAKLNCEVVELSGVSNAISPPRFKTFKLTEPDGNTWYFTNLHAPHDNQGEVLTDMLHQVMEYHIMQPGETSTEHFLAGDFNSSRQKVASHYDDAAFLIESNEDKYPSESSCQIDAKASFNEGGHQKATDFWHTKPKRVTVDAVISLKMTPLAPNSGFRFNYERVNWKQDPRVHVGQAVLSLSIMGVIFNKIKEETEKDKERNLQTQESSRVEELDYESEEPFKGAEDLDNGRGPPTNTGPK
ncbi:MAG: hypothetical protein P1U74_07660 [Legionellaceae bacterium]|nr:hypothetical protein [Legionellaceae bacterium]